MTLLPPVDELPANEICADEGIAGDAGADKAPVAHAYPDFGSRVELALSASNHLFNARNAPRYVAQVLQGVNAVATKLERTTQPFTGIGPSDMERRVREVDLDRPLPDTAAALEELERSTSATPSTFTIPNTPPT